MSDPRSADLRCADLDHLADELVEAYGQLNEDQVLALRDSLLFPNSLGELDSCIARIHRQIATHRLTCELCIQIHHAFSAAQQDGQWLN